ncbi:MAG: hypothetical protein LBU40_03155 [Methanobrevibacter sp.]|jgi:hypothetical protein|nr:hypothetical protein [Methanobrevibacter sp.]
MKELNRNHIIIFIVLLLIISSTVLLFALYNKDHIRNAVWINGRSMESVDFNQLSKNGVQNIFLNSNAVDLYGEKKVAKWVKEANEHGIKVHIWVKCFYNGKWINPIDSKTKDFNYPFFKKKVAEIEWYTHIPGVSGIHLDYVRYPGDAYKYGYSDDITPSKAITKFVEMASKPVKDKDLTLSIAVMPEKEDKLNYGQDIKAISYYVDVIVPMIYMGNYKAGPKWINETTDYFKSNAGFANLCIGIQTYESDSNLTPIPKDKLRQICQGALDNGADGVALFSYGLIDWFNLKTLI